MGKDSRIIVAIKSKDESSIRKDGKKYAQVIAEYEMCVDWRLIDWFENQPESDVFYYSGNDEIAENNYGEPLRETTIKNLADFLHNEIKTQEYYRRQPPILAMLDAFYEDRENWESECEELVAILYCH